MRDRDGKPAVDIMRLLVAIVILAWVIASLWLFNYFWESSGMRSDGLYADSSGHRLLDRSEADALNLGLGQKNPNQGIESGISDLFSLRYDKKNGDFARLASDIERIRKEVDASDEEEYRMIWAPVLSCAYSGCSNQEYIRAAGLMASRAPRWAGHAMIIQSSYWYEAASSGDAAASASAVAKLDRLVQRWGSASAVQSWGDLQKCEGKCALFEEMLLEFMQAAMGS